VERGVRVQCRPSEKFKQQGALAGEGMVALSS
jgi:hypothetical protein